MTRVVGLDLSLTTTGVAMVDLASGQTRVSRVTSKVRTVKRGDSPLTIAERSVRLRKLTREVSGLCAGAGLVVVEGPAYASDTGKAHDRAGYWWLVVGRLTGAGLNVVEVPPQTLKMYALGKGGGPGVGKDDVLAAVVRRYADVPVGNNDEADALLLAAMGARFTGHPIEPDLPQTHLRAMSAVRWT